MQKFLNFMVTALECAIIGALLVVMLLYGITREQQIRDQERLNRCAAMGESLPAEMTGYCDGQ